MNADEALSCPLCLWERAGARAAVVDWESAADRRPGALTPSLSQRQREQDKERTCH
jgi:hypothetical protein